MFTGIIEGIGIVEKIEKEGTNVHFTLSSDFSGELKIDQSLAHDGTCLTVVSCDDKQYVVTAIDETMKKTRLGSWSVGSKVNLERCLKIGDRLDGHMVQGHVDTTGSVKAIEEHDGSHVVRITHPDGPEWITVPKGSITINGISLTVVNSKPGEFSVALIPYTWIETTMHTLSPGDPVNLEFDILGKYIGRMLAAKEA